jgi:hypothetical protein
MAQLHKTVFQLLLPNNYNVGKWVSVCPPTRKLGWWAAMPDQRHPAPPFLKKNYSSTHFYRFYPLAYAFERNALLIHSFLSTRSYRSYPLACCLRAKRSALPCQSWHAATGLARHDTLVARLTALPAPGMRLPSPSQWPLPSSRVTRPMPPFRVVLPMSPCCVVQPPLPPVNSTR